MNVLEACGVSALGFGAGIIGGLAGVGGSLIMIPGLHLLYPAAPAAEHHLFVAAAMTVNVAVAVPAALKHAKAGAVRVDLLKTILPVAVAMIVAGVLLSNRVDGDALKLALAIFILGYCAFNVWQLRRGAAQEQSERATRARVAVCGAAAGLVGGLLGLGGGVVLVPMLQLLCRVPLRQSIATSSAVICISAVIGAGTKLSTLGQHELSVRDALLLAALMAPTAVLGGRLGAGLTHSLPLRTVRIAVTVLLALAAFNLMR